MIQFSKQFTPNQLNDGATKFQSLYRGYIVRKYIIFPSEEVNSFICDKVNSFIRSNRDKISGVMSAVNEERNLFIKWDRSLEVISLLFTRENRVGSGFWKVFFSSNTIKIPLISKKRQIRQFESVWTEVDSKTVNEVRIQKNLYDKFAKERPIGVYFLEPLEQIHQNVYTQKRLINKLEGTKFNDPVQKSRCMRDIARSLVWIHRQGMTHGDVHLKNCLIEERIDDEGLLRLVSYLTDFGSAKPWGSDQNRKLDDYVRWDCCKCFADINTPLMDWHGFIVTNIVVWFPEMAAYLKWEKFISIRQRVFENESRGNFALDDTYWTCSKPFGELTAMEQRAWHLFIGVCRKSTQLYLQFENKEKEVSKEEVERGLIEINASEIVRECLQFTEDMCDSANFNCGFES